MNKRSCGTDLGHDSASEPLGHRWLKRLGLTLLAFVTAGTGSLVLGAQPASAAVNGACITTERGFLSLNVAPEFDNPVGVPSGYRRLWDMRLAWNDINPAPGTWNWSTLAYRIDQVKRSGNGVLYVMGLTPQWAAADPSAGDPRWGLGTASPPADMGTWSAYVNQVVDNFGGSIDAYELWNEANLRTFWSGTPEQLAEMTKIAHDIIQAKDPSALVLAPSITTRLTSSSENFLRAFVPALVAQGLPVEGWSIHSYPDGDSDPGERVRDVRYYQSVMTDLLAAAPSALKLPLWDTEVNYGVKGPANIPGRAFSEVDGARLMRSTFADSQALGIDATFWYMYTLVPNGILGVQFTPDTALTQAAWAEANAAFAPGTPCPVGQQTSDPETVASTTPPARTITLQARREPGPRNRITVSGTTTIPPGQVLRPFLRPAGTAAFQPSGPKVVVGEDGTFTWQTRGGRALQIRFTSEAGTTTSNTVTVPAV